MQTIIDFVIAALPEPDWKLIIGVFFIVFDLLLFWIFLRGEEFWREKFFITPKGKLKVLLVEEGFALNKQDDETEHLLRDLKNYSKRLIHDNLYSFKTRHDDLKQEHGMKLLELYSKYNNLSKEEAREALLKELYGDDDDDDDEDELNTNEERPLITYVKACNQRFNIDVLSNGVMNFFITDEGKSIMSYFGEYSCVNEDVCTIFIMNQYGLIVINCKNFKCEKLQLEKCISARALSILNTYKNKCENERYLFNVVCYGQGEGKWVALKVAELVELNSRKVWAVLQRETSFFDYIYKPTGLIDTIASILHTSKTSKLRGFKGEAQQLSKMKDVQNIGLEYVALHDC